MNAQTPLLDATGQDRPGRGGLTRMTRLEVVVNGSDVALLHDVLTGAGASGYTSVSNVSGLGHHGFHAGTLAFNDRDTLQMVVAVVPDDVAETALDGVRRLLARRPGVVFVSDTWVSRPEYFR